MPNERVLLELGWKYLPKAGQILMETLICRAGSGDFEFVQAGILGAIDGALFKKNISYKEAKNDYLLLGMTPEAASKVRQKATKFEFKNLTAR